MYDFGFIVNPKKLETGLRTTSAGIPYTILKGIEAVGFPTFGLLLCGSGFPKPEWFCWMSSSGALGT